MNQMLCQKLRADSSVLKGSLVLPELNQKIQSTQQISQQEINSHRVKSFCLQVPVKVTGDSLSQGNVSDLRSCSKPLIDIKNVPVLKKQCIEFDANFINKKTRNQSSNPGQSIMPPINKPKITELLYPSSDRAFDTELDAKYRTGRFTKLDKQEDVYANKTQSGFKYFTKHLEPTKNGGPFLKELLANQPESLVKPSLPTDHHRRRNSIAPTHLAPLAQSTDTLSEIQWKGFSKKTVGNLDKKKEEGEKSENKGDDEELKEYMIQSNYLHNRKRIHYNPQQILKESPMIANLSVQKAQKKRVKRFKSMCQDVGKIIQLRSEKGGSSQGQEDSQSDSAISFKVQQKIYNQIGKQQRQEEISEALQKNCGEQIDRILKNYLHTQVISKDGEDYEIIKPKMYLMAGEDDRDQIIENPEDEEESPVKKRGIPANSQNFNDHEQKEKKKLMEPIIVTKLEWPEEKQSVVKQNQKCQISKQPKLLESEAVRNRMLDSQKMEALYRSEMTSLKHMSREQVDVLIKNRINVLKANINNLADDAMDKDAVHRKLNLFNEDRLREELRKIQNKKVEDIHQIIEDIKKKDIISNKFVQLPNKEKSFESESSPLLKIKLVDSEKEQQEIFIPITESNIPGADIHKDKNKSSQGQWKNTMDSTADGQESMKDLDDQTKISVLTPETGQVNLIGDDSSFTVSCRSYKGDTKGMIFKNEQRQFVIKGNFTDFSGGWSTKNGDLSIKIGDSEFTYPAQSRVPADFGQSSDMSNYFVKKGSIEDRELFKERAKKVAQYMQKKRVNDAVDKHINDRPASQLDNPIVDYIIGAYENNSLIKLAPFLKDNAPNSHQTNQVFFDSSTGQTDFSDILQTDNDELLESMSNTDFSAQKEMDFDGQRRDMMTEHILDYKIENFIIKDQFTNAFGRALKSIPPINKNTQKSNVIYLSLIQNNLKDQEFIDLLDQLPKELVRGIQIQQNSLLSPKSYEYLGQKLKQYQAVLSNNIPLGMPNNCFASLKSLVLENCKMNDSSLEILMKNGMESCQTLEYLNLSLNSISCRGIETMTDYFTSGCSMSLKTLLLHWNRIRGRGAVRLFKLIQKGAKNLRELDLSFNTLGQYHGKSIPKQDPSKNEEQQKEKQELNKVRSKISLSVYKLGRFIAKNDILQHLDISFCGIEGREAIEFLGSQLAKNTTLLGIHIQRGNLISMEGLQNAKAQIDTLGHLHFVEENTKDPELDCNNGNIGSLGIQNNYQMSVLDRQKAEIQNKLNSFKRIGLLNFNRDDLSGTKNKQLYSHKDNIDNCWICGKWKQAELFLELPRDKQNDVSIKGQKPMYVTLSTQNKKIPHLLEFDYEKKLMMKERIVKKQVAEGTTKKFREYRLLRMLPFEQQIPNFYPVYSKHALLQEDSSSRNQDKTKKNNKNGHSEEEIANFQEDLQSVKELLQVDDDSVHIDILKEINNQFDNIDNNSMLDSSVNSRSTLTKSLSSCKSLYISTLQHKKIDEYAFFFTDLQKINYTYKNRPVMCSFDNEQNMLILKDVKEVELLAIDDDFVAEDNTISTPKRQQTQFKRLVKPRQALLQPPSLTPKKKPWTREISLFYQYQEDTPELSDQVFQFDWKCSKIEKMLQRFVSRENIEKLYEFLRQRYQKIKNIYKFYSSIYPAGGLVPCIGQNILTEIVYNCPGLLDRVNINLSKVDLYFITVRAQQCQKQDLKIIPKLKPDKFIIRYQFLEFLVNMARERYAYTKSGYKIELDQYIIKMVNENLQDLMDQPKFEVQGWRDRLYWNEQCDNALKQNVKVLKDIFKAYTGRLSQAGTKSVYMSLQEFIEICEKLSILSDQKDNEQIQKAFGGVTKKDLKKNPGDSSVNSSITFSDSQAKCLQDQENSRIEENKQTEKDGTESFPALSEPGDNDHSMNFFQQQEERALQQSLLTGSIRSGGMSTKSIKLLQNCQLYARDIPNIFFMSIQTRVDELSSDMHTKMQFVEFLEAVARIADKAQSIGPHPDSGWLERQVGEQIQIVEGMRQEFKYTKMMLDQENSEFIKPKKKVYDAKRLQMRKLRIERELLAHKIIAIVQRMAMVCLGPEYATQYSREYLQRRTESRMKKELEQIFGLEEDSESELEEDSDY